MALPLTPFGSRWSRLAEALEAYPRYTLMRGAARFSSVREVVSRGRQLLQRGRLRAHMSECEARIADSPFARLDRVDFVRQLREDGMAHGLQLPEALSDEIVAHASQHACYADRLPDRGFRCEERALAEAALGKPILVAQYFNVAERCVAVARLCRDPVLQWIAGAYLQSVPTFVGANLWWTFPVEALDEDRDRHAHMFHRDVDDFRFFKFFFYLTDVQRGDGAHVCVAASHRRPPLRRFGDRWNIRRYTDDEVEQSYPAAAITEICGPVGSGFAENTLCVHKGLTPTKHPRLLLQLQFALFDHGVTHDRRPADVLQRLV